MGSVVEDYWYEYNHTNKLKMGTVLAVGPHARHARLSSVVQGVRDDIELRSIVLRTHTRTHVRENHVPKMKIA